MVYTWVNGSDPEWLKVKNARHTEFLLSLMGGNQTEAFNPSEEDDGANGENRFRTHDELKYSLRSVEKHAPWVRYIHIVVADGQVPAWLNTSHPKIRVVPHSVIYQNLENLPTFNSNGIESQLPNIPGLADYFLYANDDMFFGNKVEQGDFFVSPKTGQQKRYDEGWPVKRTCAKNCSFRKLQDGVCNPDCNVAACNWDYGDCGGSERVQQLKTELKAQLGFSDQTFEPGNAGYWQMIEYVDGVYNREFRARKRPRNVIRHMPHLKNKRMMQDMIERFRPEFDWTASHPFRHEQDMQSCFSYDYYLSAVQVYAPTVQQAWGSAFNTVDRPNRIFLYDRLPRDWDAKEYLRYKEIVASPEYNDIKECTRSMVAGEEVNGGECSRTMSRLVEKLRLPFDKDRLGTKSLVDFRILYNDNDKKEADTIMQLEASARTKRKFVTINDDLKRYTPKVENALDEMYRSFFPEHSDYEIRSLKI
ncbi:MAG: hypothetical protein SGILL_001791 [Bacillariaceae sp.]